MRLAFVGDLDSRNAQTWVAALRGRPGIDVRTWSLPRASGRVSRLVRLGRLCAAVPLLRRWLGRVGPDLVIAYRTTSYGFLAAASGFHPLVVAAQGETDVWPPDSPLAPIKAAMARYALTRADLVHAWGEHIAKTVRALGARPETILVLPRGVDLDRFRMDPRGPRGMLRLVTTRSLAPEYGHDTIVRAVGQVVRDGSDVEMHFAGGGAERHRLAVLAESLGIGGRTIFHGEVPYAALPRVLAEADIYVSMPITEGVSASLLEAMACGCFPIVTDLPANRDWIVDGETGCLVPSGDWKRLACSLTAASVDPSMRARAAHRNRALVESRASLSVNIGRFVDVYRSLVRGAP